MLSSLLGAQRDQWVYFRRLPRRNPAGQERYSQQQQDDSAERQRIGRLHFIEQASEIARQRERSAQTDPYAGASQSHSLTDDQTEYSARTRAQRQSNAHLMRPLPHGIGQNAVDAHGSQ